MDQKELKSIYDSIDSSGVSYILIWFPKSELDEWSDEEGSDYQDDNEEEASGSTEDIADEEEVQDGNANEDEVKVGGGGGGAMPEMPTKMPSPEKMNDQEKWCGNIYCILYKKSNFLFLSCF